MVILTAYDVPGIESSETLLPTPPYSASQRLACERAHRLRRLKLQ
jgi:hypothetical protein